MRLKKFCCAQERRYLCPAQAIVERPRTNRPTDEMNQSLWPRDALGADTRRVLDRSVRIRWAPDHCVAISTAPRTDLDAFDTYEAAKTAILGAYNDVMFSPQVKTRGAFARVPPIVECCCAVSNKTHWLCLFAFAAGQDRGCSWRRVQNCVWLSTAMASVQAPLALTRGRCRQSRSRAAWLDSDSRSRGPGCRWHCPLLPQAPGSWPSSSLRSPAWRNSR